MLEVDGFAIPVKVYGKLWRENTLLQFSFLFLSTYHPGSQIEIATLSSDRNRNPVDVTAKSFRKFDTLPNQYLLMPLSNANTAANTMSIYMQR